MNGLAGAAIRVGASAADGADRLDLASVLRETSPIEEAQLLVFRQLEIGPHGKQVLLDVVVAADFLAPVD